MIRVNVPLQIYKSKGNFIHGDIIKMHTIHEKNCAVTKLTCDGNSTKKLTKNNPVCRSYQAQLMEALDFTQIIHS